jgi:glycosyl transferase family 2
MRLLLIVPVYNEISLMEKNVPLLNDYLKKNAKTPFMIVVSAFRYSKELEDAGGRLERVGVKFFSTEKRGKGAGLIEAHRAFAEKGDWVGYIDLDMPVSLGKLSEACDIMADGGYDLVAARRYGKGASIKGSLKRRLLSRGYVALANLILFGWPRVQDFQAGFKFWRKEAFDDIMAAAHGGLDRKWFFDTELIYYARKLGKRIAFLPVDYELEAASGATTMSSPAATSAAFLRNLLRLRFRSG